MDEPALAARAEHTPNLGGRPSILTDELISQCADLVREGHYLLTVCNALRISKSVLYNWLQRGDADITEGNPSTAHARFVDAVKTAEGWAEIQNSRDWKESGAFWAKYATFAERRWPERWRKRDDSENQPRVVIQVGVRDGDVALALSPLTPLVTKVLSEGQ